MGMTFFKRFRMEFDLRNELPQKPAIPQEFELLAWRANLLYAHADAKYHSFRHELDSNVFPCLAQRDGCTSLMREISSRSGFVPEATWLIVKHEPSGKVRRCGTIQGLSDRPGVGSIQNLGIVPEYRSLGLARALLYEALQGFRTAGLTMASLEVTANNQDAIRLYQKFGFRTVKTVFKSLDIVHA